MNKLTTNEQKVFNNLSRSHDSSVLLGDKLQEMINSVGESGTPVNAVAASKLLTISGVSIDGETITINNPAKTGVDVYEFLADAALTKTSPSNIAIDINATTVKANNTLTVDTQPTSGDTLTIGTKTYIFVPVGTANSVGEISIGADLAGAQSAIIAAINGTDGINQPHPTVSAGAFAANVSIVTALIGGTVGNSISTTETFTAATNVFSASTLGSGTNCTAVNTVSAIIAAINSSDTQGVSATTGEGNTVVITADVAGVVGNAITIAETMANGAFDASATVLSGGIDGTVASGIKFMTDSTYLYFCISGNTTAQNNWRRISLGSAY